MGEPLDLSLNAWAVLALLVDDGPSHGFALSKELAKGTPIGQVWAVSRPLVYRALDQLADRGLARAGATQPGAAGPARQEYRATTSGRAALRRWRRTPVTHLRDVRSELVLKLLLATRAGEDVSALLLAQRRRFEPLMETLRAEREQAEGPSRIVAVWRYELAQATERTLDELARGV